MTAADWIGAAGLVLTGGGMGAVVVYRTGQIVARVAELSGRVDKNEDRLRRIEGKIDRVPKRKAPNGLD